MFTLMEKGKILTSEQCGTSQAGQHREPLDKISEKHHLQLELELSCVLCLLLPRHSSLAGVNSGAFLRFFNRFGNLFSDLRNKSSFL